MKPILLFGAKGASDAVEDLTKAQVKGYTRADGTYVKPHTTGRQAAKPKPAPVTRSENEGYGFHNAAYHSHRREKYGPDGDVPNGKGKEAQEASDSAFSRVAHELVSAGHFDKHEHARDFLDSVHGRHLGDEIGHNGSIKDVKWLPKSVSRFKASEGIPLKKSVLLFGDGIGDLAKAQVKGYTRSDGTYVKPHTTSRQAAAPKQPHPKTKAHMESMIASANQDGRKFGKKTHYIGSHEQDIGGKKVGVTSHTGKEYKQSWSLDGKTVGPEKVQAHLDQHYGGKTAPALGANAKALRASSKEGHMDHWHNQHAADLMESGDHEVLSHHLRNMDTAARDHVLDHIHPDHWEKLGFKPLDKERSVKNYHEKFGGSPGGAAKEKPKAEPKPKASKKAAKDAGENLGSLAERHGSEGERHYKMAMEKGKDHPDHQHHMAVSRLNNQAQYHLEQAQNADNDEDRNMHMGAFHHVKGKIKDAESNLKS